MEFNSQVCTNYEQSKRLTALGIKDETADMIIIFDNKWYANCTKYNALTPSDFAEFEAHDIVVLPAWSLHRMIEMIAGGKWKDYMVFVPYAYDSIIDDIETEIEKGFFNEDYLDESRRLD